MSEATINAASWKALRKQPKVVTLETLSDAKVILRPLSSLRHLQLEQETEGAADGKAATLSAILADTVVSGEIDGAKIVSIGGPIWKRDELVSEEFPTETLQELTRLVLDYLGLGRRDPSKN
jgi:hypothetical protein